MGQIPVAFRSYLPFVGKLKDTRRAYRGHRSVCLPDYQGVGIGHAMITYLASMWSGLGYRVFRNTGHPAEIAAASRSKDWEVMRMPSRTAAETTGSGIKHATNRLTASFEYAGPKLRREDALVCLNSWGVVA
jgi:hypothetical protein